jgi:hypothetical protein
VVSVLASGTQDRVFEPGRSRQIFQGEKIHSMPSFGGEVKPSVPCRRFAACKRTLWLMWKSESQAKLIDHFSPYIRPSLTEVSHVAWRGMPLEMMGGTKGGAQRARLLRPRCFQGGSPETATLIYHLPNKRHLVYCVCIMSVGCATIAVSFQSWHSQLTLYSRNIPSAICA